ncbi:MAG TPA: hypothetical protein VJ927_01845 [Actinomycetota bacterium]|nr:hypothetical protein [Actinomycetota bacterium]
MGGPINVGGDLWHQADDGTWFKWNATAARWEPSAEPPTASGDAPPPPPVPSPEGGAPSLAPTPDLPPAQVAPTPQAAEPAASPSPSRDFVVTTGRGGPYIPPLVLLIAGAVLVLVAFLAFVTLTGSDDDPTVAPPPPPPPAPAAAGAISPRNERSIYSVLKEMQGCFGPETLAWAGELRAGSLDRAGLKDDIARISSNLEDLRRRRFPEPVDAKIVPRSRVGKLAARISAADINTEESKIDTKILVALGILAPGTDLEELGRKIVEEGVAGFYVPETKKLYAGIGSEGFVALDEIVLAHELDHALMDATLGLPKLVSDDPAESDRMTAHRAAIEGDATLAMLHYAVASFDPSEWQQLLSDPSAAGAVDAEAVPYVLQKSLVFPYSEGLLFACDLFSRGGWKGVERSLRNPPTSSDQILFPDRYLRQTEVVDAPDPAAPAGWEEVRSTAFGAADLLWMIQAARDVPMAEPDKGVEAVRGWAGGELHAWENGGDLAIQITLVDGGIGGKKDEVGYTLCRSLRGWYQDRFEKARVVADEATRVWRNGDSFAASSCRDQTPRLSIAPSREIAEELVAAE